MNQQSKVKIWEESIVLPTYKVSPPEKNPIFIEKRAYQGSTGRVYPLPVIEKIATEKEDVAYRAIYLENEYLQVMILPELGGRIQRALDKTNNYDFVYYNHVIKPALVGLVGPWISGGIEFNWPQHHRPSTYMPVDYHLKENADGSCSVYVGEVDKMYGTKGMACFTLYPDKAYIEIKGQLYNPTDLPQTFLWWANPAVPVNDHTYSVFPPDVNAVMDHGKRAVSTFPIATGEYYKYDYSAGVDISMYKNVPVPTSYMAAKSDYDFIGNYDSGIEAGLLHVADHHISPGKKQWTWGNADFGQAWDRNLTDEDGPYIELMTGVFTDNQPDFTWLKPQEEKTFVQYFMPYKGVGRVKNASKDVAINVSLKDGKGELLLYASGVFEKANITISKQGETIFEQILDLSPKAMEVLAFDVEDDSLLGYAVSIRDAKGRELLCYEPVERKLEPVPDPAAALPEPVELKSCEELYLAGTHLEQYRHATREPADYYLEGLKRDPNDIRLNNSYGLLLLRRGDFEQARTHFLRAVERQTWKNPNPYHGEGYFNLGLAQVLLGEDEKAYDAFYKATWSQETQSAGFYWLACLAAKKGAFEDALAFVEKSLLRNWHNMKGRGLKASLQRKLGQDNRAFLAENIHIDPLDMRSRYEWALAEDDLSTWKGYMREEAHHYLLLALDYMQSGFFAEAVAVLDQCSADSPLLHYYKGYALHLAGDDTGAKAAYAQGEKSNPDYCFPNKAEEVNILKHVIRLLGKAPFAKHYLADLYYDKRQYSEAISFWEASLAENDAYALTHRNLAIAYFDKEKDAEKARKAMESALKLAPQDTRILLEYDQLCGRVGVSVAQRLERLRTKKALLRERNALYVEYITLLNNAGEYEKAFGCLQGHIFQPWEGGEGKVSGQYRFALTQMALADIESGDDQKAIDKLLATLHYPENLGEGKLPNVQDNAAHYHLGRAYKQMGDEEKAREYFEKAAVGMEEPAMALYYNEQPSDTMYYQGLANEALGNHDAARKNYHQLLSFGSKHLFDKVEYDFFAVSLPELDVFPIDMQQRNDVYCQYLMALGEMGLGNREKAQALFDAILALQPDHQGAICHKAML